MINGKTKSTQGTEFDVYNHIRKEGAEGENERWKERMEGEKKTEKKSDHIEQKERNSKH